MENPLNPIIEISRSEKNLLFGLTTDELFGKIYSHEFSQVDHFLRLKFPDDPLNKKRLKLAERVFSQLQIVFIRDNNPIWNALASEPQKGWKAVFTKDKFIKFCDRYHGYLQWAREHAISEIMIVAVFGRIHEEDPRLAKKLSEFATQIKIDLKSPQGYSHSAEIIKMVPKTLGRLDLENAYAKDRQYLEWFNMRDHAIVMDKEMAETFLAKSLQEKNGREIIGSLWLKYEKMKMKYGREKGDFRRFINKGFFNEKMNYYRMDDLKMTGMPKKTMIEIGQGRKRGETNEDWKIETQSHKEKWLHDEVQSTWRHPQLPDQLSKQAKNPEGEILEKELKELLNPLKRDKLNIFWERAKLNREQRRIMEFMLNELSVTQIAHKLGKGENATRQSLQKARTKIKSFLHLLR